MPTELDIDAAEIAQELLAEFGAPYVFRDISGAFDPAFGGVVAFWSSAISASAGGASIHWQGGDFGAHGVAVGSRLQFSGWRTPALNGAWLTVAAVSGDTLTVTTPIPSEGAGAKVGAVLAVDHPVNGYIDQWDARYVNGTSILPTDSRVMFDSTDGYAPTVKSTLFFDGPDPAAAQQYTVWHRLPIYSGELFPVTYAGVRA